ncbi:MAG: SPFH domain-containing protein [Planctomycetota bacterium]|jgi:membrane protease subunit HflC
MNKKVVVIILIIAIIAALLAASLLVSSLFTVDENKQAIVTQLGKFIREVKQPGLHFKIPLIQKEHKFEAGVMEYDAVRRKIFTNDKKHLVINISARWKIVEPLKFYQTVRNEYYAQSILDDIVFSEIREELARHTLTEIVSVNVEQIMDTVAEQCNQKAGDYGIQVIDVQINRADLPQER